MRTKTKSLPWDLGETQPLKALQGEAVDPKGPEPGVPQQVQELLLLVRVPHPIHEGDVIRMWSQEADDPLRPSGPKVLFQLSLGCPPWCLEWCGFQCRHCAAALMISGGLRWYSLHAFVTAVALA